MENSGEGQEKNVEVVADPPGKGNENLLIFLKNRFESRSGSLAGDDDPTSGALCLLTVASYQDS
jgi:hypothetical protein